MVNRLLRETEVHPEFLSGKCIPADFKFYLGKLTNKKIPHME